MPQYRALNNLALRKSPKPCACPNDEDVREDCTNPDWHAFFEWPAGTEFDAPEHMKTALALATGKIEAV